MLGSRLQAVSWRHRWISQECWPGEAGRHRLCEPCSLLIVRALYWAQQQQCGAAVCVKLCSHSVPGSLPGWVVNGRHPPFFEGLRCYIFAAHTWQCVCCARLDWLMDRNVVLPKIVAACRSLLGGLVEPTLYMRCVARVLEPVDGAFICLCLDVRSCHALSNHCKTFNPGICGGLQLWDTQYTVRVARGQPCLKSCH